MLTHPFADPATARRLDAALAELVGAMRGTTAASLAGDDVIAASRVRAGGGRPSRHADAMICPRLYRRGRMGNSRDAGCRTELPAGQVDAGRDREERDRLVSALDGNSRGWTPWLLLMVRT